MYIDTTAVAGTPVMTRTEKLLRWADLIRKSPTRPTLHHRVEYISSENLHLPYFYSDGSSVFGIATVDPKFQEAGLVSTGTTNQRGTNSVKDIMKFFGLTQEQLHEFSCNCGGEIDREEMARRVERLAA